MYSSHIERLFRKNKDIELRQWFISVVGNGNGNAIGFIRQALECLRLFGSLSAAESIQHNHKSLQVLIAWHTGELEPSQAAAFIGCEIDDLPGLWWQAVEAGVRLADG